MNAGEVRGKATEFTSRAQDVLRAVVITQSPGAVMAIKTTTLQGGTIGVIEVKGSLIGGEETDELKGAIADFVEQGNKKLIIDLSKVTYLNSTAIGVLLKAHTEYSSKKGLVKLCGINQNIHNTFVISKLTMVFDVCETREEAIKAFMEGVAP
jgi:anti-sigma B factor antagonist